MMEQLIFFVLASVVLAGALCVVTVRNVLHSALSLGLCLLGVAGIFAMLGADFLFASQILIYVGGIAVLVLFVVLLAGRHSDLVLRQTNNQWLAGLLICGLTGRAMYSYIKPYGDSMAYWAAKPTTAELARLLLKELAVPFELISLLLLAALAGAVIFSQPEAK